MYCCGCGPLLTVVVTAGNTGAGAGGGPERVLYLILLNDEFELPAVGRGVDTCFGGAGAIGCPGPLDMIRGRVRSIGPVVGVSAAGAGCRVGGGITAEVGGGGGGGGRVDTGG